MPAVWMVQSRNQLGTSRLAKRWNSRLNKNIGDDAVNPAPIIATVEVDVLLDSLRQRPRVLNHFAIHVSDVQRTIRADLHLHWAEPVIRRGEEFPVTLILWSLAMKLIPAG